jgi:4-amino-4-deoxy-L-arabinose transferase-like glycosyltransferase
MALILTYSVVFSGYWYSFYGDELVHVNMMYLIAHGSRPFIDFFTIYSPVFHYMMAPIFIGIGFTLRSIQYSHVVMIVLFAIRLYFGFLFVKKLFSKTTALFFVYIMLLDPIIIFSSMQIRPDNLLMIVFTIGLWKLVSALEEKTDKQWFLTGVCMAVSVVVSLKIALCVAVISGTMLAYSFRNTSIKRFFSYLFGVFSVIGIFVMYYVLQGSLSAMILHIITYTFAKADSLMNPTWFGFFYLPNNNILYGLAGKPVSWYIAVTLPYIGIAGMAISLYVWRRSTVKRWLIVMFIIMQFVQYRFFLTVKSMYLQYYLTYDWIFALFAAEIIRILFLSVKKPRVINTIMQGVLCLAFGYLVVTNYPANMERAKSVTMVDADKVMEETWATIPENEAVYPAMLFRPLSQPIPFGFFLPEIPESIKKNLPSSYDVLKDKHIRYLSLSDYELQFTDPATVSFIREHYSKYSKGLDLWILKD